ncbi:MAG: hypothetical protein GYA23_06310 [Methanomicrobiales archaeon]|nr:hypothetical protein [Methanomicrobiales archaeon]
MTRNPQNPRLISSLHFLLALCLIACPALAASTSLDSAPSPGNTTGTISAIYFYGDTCSHCAKVKMVLDDLEARYPDFTVTRLEIYNNATNLQKFFSVTRTAGIPDAGVPLLVINSRILMGDRDIISGVENEIIAERVRMGSCNTTPEPPVVASEPSCAAPAGLSLPVVIAAALIDSLNPCGLSVLVFLLIAMAAAGSRKRILMAGGAYIAATFLFHLLVGVGLFSVFSLSGLAKLFSLIGGAVALVLGLLTVADVLHNKETFILSIPASGKGLLGDYIRMASLPGAFVLGILAGILGFSCTGGIYISILGLMGRDMTVMTGMPWLLLYNFVYVLPLVIVTLLVAVGLSPERAERLRAEYKRSIRLVIGLVLIALGLIIFLGWFG